MNTHSQMSFDQSHPIRVVVEQPALPKYRVPVFRELAQRPRIDLRVDYGCEEDLPNATPAGFEASLSPTHRLPGSLYWRSAQIRAVSLGGADVVLFSWNVRYLSLVPALLLARRRNIASIVWGHGYSKQETAVRLAYRRQVAALATAVLFYTDHEAQRYIAASGHPERVFVARNAIDTRSIEEARATWVARPLELAQFRVQHRLGSDVVLFVSRLIPANRLDVLLDATAILRPSVPGLSVVVIGDGPSRADLEAYARRLGILGTVQFPGAIYDETQLAPWFLSAKVFCYPANAGLSLLHSFGYGVPVIVGDTARAHGPEIEALRPGENGALFRDGNPNALARSLSNLLGDNELRSRMRDICLHTAREEHTISRMVDGMENAIHYADSMRRSR